MTAAMAIAATITMSGKATVARNPSGKNYLTRETRIKSTLIRMMT
jgi:hypothetical protein